MPYITLHHPAYDLHAARRAGGWIQREALPLYVAGAELQLDTPRHELLLFGRLHQSAARADPRSIQLLQFSLAEEDRAAGSGGSRVPQERRALVHVRLLSAGNLEPLGCRPAPPSSHTSKHTRSSRMSSSFLEGADVAGCRCFGFVAAFPVGSEAVPCENADASFPPRHALCALPASLQPGH